MKSEYNFSKATKSKSVKEIKVVKTFRLDADVLEWLEKQGEKEGLGYQTYLNWFLRKSMLESSSMEDRLLKIERAIFHKKAK
jgi:uncharacterized protein (DUF4415 family)